MTYVILIVGILSGVYLTIKLTPIRANLHKTTQSISIIIPARNEAKRLPALLESLKHYDHEVIVVDDHSDDATANIAKHYGVKVITPPTRPEGIKGKPWALLAGVGVASHDIIMLLDADTVILNQGIEKMLFLYEKHQCPISIQPYHRMQRFYEHFSMLFNLIVVMSSNTYALFHRQTHAFFGPCQIMKKEDFITYGHDPKVTSHVLEDIKLGQVLLENNIPIKSIIGKHMIAFRMYPEGMKDLINGFTKNFASGAIAIRFIQSLLLTLWLSSLYASINIMIQATIGRISYDIPMIFYGVIVIITRIQTRHIGNFTIIDALLYPIHAVFFLMTFIYSLFKIFIFKNNTWKGRRV